MPDITVTCLGRASSFAAGTRAGEILHAMGAPDAVAAVLDNHVVDLATPLDADSTVAPVRTTDPLSFAILRRTAGHLLRIALTRRAPAARLVVGQSLFGGHYYELHGVDADLDRAALAAALTADIDALADLDLPFERRAVSLEGAPRYLDDDDGSKAALLRSWPRPLVPLIGLHGTWDIQHGPYAPSTQKAKGYRVVAFADGFILQHPAAPTPSSEKMKGLFRVYKETRDWNRRVGVASVGDLNAAALADRADEVVRVAEALHEKKLAEIADQIAARRDHVRFICVAGPSSAGKTTFVRRLSVQLRVNGIEPVMVGLDDYYRDRQDCPKDDNGDYDFEAFEALDKELIHAHLEALLEKAPVDVPRFDFVTGTRKPASPERRLALRDDQVLLVEGIHGLNPALTGKVPKDAIFRIYINALTELRLDAHNRIFTADMRLLRRIVRDRRYRGTSAAETIARWPSVRRGEEQHIFPFQDEADATFNSALVYETAVLKTFAWRYLLECDRAHPSRVEAYRLLRLLDLFVPLFPDAVPATSVLREFVGGSGFAY